MLHHSESPLIAEELLVVVRITTTNTAAWVWWPLLLGFPNNWGYVLLRCEDWVPHPPPLPFVNKTVAYSEEGILMPTMEVAYSPLHDKGPLSPFVTGHQVQQKMTTMMVTLCVLLVFCHLRVMRCHQAAARHPHTTIVPPPPPSVGVLECCRCPTQPASPVTVSSSNHRPHCLPDPQPTTPPV